MDDLLSEKEQIDQIRSWWSTYGGYVIGGLGLGIAGLAGINYYTTSKLEGQIEGSALYESLTDHVATGSVESAEAVVAQLSTDYTDTSYAAQSLLAMARLYMDQNRDQDAADALRRIVDGDADVEIKLVARARLARVLLYQNQPQEVIDLLEGQETTAFAAIYNELLGDAYHALGRIEDAQTAYQSVMLDPMAPNTVDQRLVQWKALDLPEASSPAETMETPAAEEPAAEEAVEGSEVDDTEAEETE
ncbi:MAG: tetratricopeptide repeat protein [Gammaproteobacteria bacterium]|nr:tetratricopeptide repeat protein [Gammaproteobacteria bacterium]